MRHKQADVKLMAETLSAEYDSAESAAQAALDTAWEIIQRNGCNAVSVADNDDTSYQVGPFPNVTAAKGYAKRVGGVVYSLLPTESE